MSEPLLLAVIAMVGICLPVLITQVAAIVIAINARREIKEEVKVAKEDIKVVVAEQAKKLDETGQKLDTIHTQTNSNLTELKKLNQDLTEEVKSLRKEKDEKAGADSKSL